MSEHEDYELGRRLRRAAGEVPDVYVAYDQVVDRVGTIRRRRRTAATGVVGVAVLVAGASFALGLRTHDRSLETAGPDTESTVPETSVTIGVQPVAVTTTTVSLPPTTEVDVTTTLPSVDPTVAPVPTDAPILDTVPPTVEVAPPATDPAPIVTVPTTTAKPKPKPKPTPTSAPVVTTPPTEPAVTDPPVTDPPVDTTATEPPPVTVPDTEPPIPVPPQVVTQTYVDPIGGNTVVAALQNGQLSFLTVAPASGFTETDRETTGKRLRITFESAAQSVRITVTIDGVTIRFAPDSHDIEPFTV